MNIIIGADIVPTQSNERVFSGGDIDALIGEDLKSVLSKADYRIFNLETPLVDSLCPIKKCGPTLAATKETIVGIKKIGVDLFTLANNHILDQGIQGIQSTVSTLDSVGISWIGIGDNVTRMECSKIVDIEEKKIGVFACAEHEFSIALEDKPGANPFDARFSISQISSIKTKCDYLVVLYHGGKEEYKYPTPELQKNCRSIIDAGADIVICQHSHCIGCEELYKKGRIVYGQGNFIFDEGSNELWNTSLLVEIRDNFEVGYIPIIKKDYGIRLASDIEKQTIMSDFITRSEKIQSEAFIKESFESLCAERENHYLLRLLGVNRLSFLFRIMNRITNRKWENYVIKKRLNSSYLLTLINFIECEPHREILLTILKKRV